MTPTHALFRRLFAISNIRVATYDFLPDAKSAYPFVYIGENNGTESPNKDLLSRLRQTVHLYGLMEDRANLDDISAYLESEVKRAHDGYDYHLHHASTSKQIIPDKTDVQPLLHIVLDFTFDYTKKEK